MEIHVRVIKTKVAGLLLSPVKLDRIRSIALLESKKGSILKRSKLKPQSK